MDQSFARLHYGFSFVIKNVVSWRNCLNTSSSFCSTFVERMSGKSRKPGFFVTSAFSGIHTFRSKNVAFLSDTCGLEAKMQK